ncbi:hypothetical protein E4U19_005832 [Claviceps sp. Clav32 group G5]|nr:hypothetical protein E4U40_000291 [Claviceps sp. LM458 group G5]KAG6039511.1 hypothetical protein E4U19_005832 [Claviceps sp. Clav32 group G5]KAG6044088.1 hypothetical protein E4U39_003714 [Claviceps sp. Clav50 group G5]KAG6049436.1 hypothetical protein E4U17_006834 [Claviceps sp. LM77 group G4]KAG6060557.1 hypothetical protein E4U33_006904 [Claviceps sp. LM78 group G4]KAG6070520.1 hypothetical protein E4U16_006806 [Claviceps sp. LM84 group G4]
MRASAAFVALAAASAHAQTANYNFTSELDMMIDPNTVTQTNRAIWCQGQTNTCDLLCNNNAESNTCSTTDLKWSCSCASNSSMPGIQYYKQTMPFYICMELFSQCITTNAGNARGQDVCTKNINALCATHDPPKAPVVDSGSGDAPASTGAAQPTSSGGSGSGDSKVTSTTSHAFAGPTMAPVGHGAFAAAMGLMAMML